MPKNVHTCLLPLIIIAACACSHRRATAEIKPTKGEVVAARQAKLPVEPPKDAVVLFDGEGTNLMLSMQGGPIDWPVQQGSLVSTRGQRRANHVVSKLHFRDAEIHVEFMLPENSKGNSGVYIHGNYELQIYNSAATRARCPGVPVRFSRSSPASCYRIGFPLESTAGVD